MWSSKAKVTAEQEAAAVVELRSRLTDGTQPVEDQLRKGGEPGLGKGLDDQTLLRWLRAEDNDVSKAEKRLRKHAPWREEEFPNGSISEDEIQNELKADKVYLADNDRYGRCVMVLKTNRHFRHKRDIKEMNRFLCYCLDAGIALADPEKNPQGKICGIFDLRDISMANIDNAALRGVFDMLQNHYPERLGTLWMYESPSIFWVLWKAVSPFIDPVTKQKVRFVYEKTGTAEMSEEISLEALPKDFGGQAELRPMSTLKIPKKSTASTLPVSSTQTPGIKSGEISSSLQGLHLDNQKLPTNGQVMGP